MIGTWLVRLLNPTSQEIPPPEMLIAIINAIIDIYADEGREYDRRAFVEGGFLEQLTGVLGRVRTDVSTGLYVPY